MRPGGKRGRKTIRSIKRARYAVKFEHKYAMKRSAWVKFKKENPQAAHALRMKY